ncbi:MAG: helix-turn-helix transcriptional regulator [Muribaculaceae bacterium]|nr:helix-turn-helix transcriptional regulator [Muribaculaceae bacterium]
MAVPEVLNPAVNKQLWLRKLAFQGEIGATLAKRRVDKGISLDDLAEISGVSSVTIRELEKGTRNATLEVLFLLTNALDLEVKIEPIK